MLATDGELWRNSKYVNHQPDISINFIDDVDSSPMQKCNLVRQYEVGDWKITHYADEYSEDDYPGEVMSVAENEITVSVMHRSGSFFIWPNHKNEINHCMEFVIGKIDP